MGDCSLWAPLELRGKASVKGEQGTTERLHSEPDTLEPVRQNMQV